MERTCQNCKHYYIEYGKKGNVIGDGCKIEDDIPFFDRELYIGFVETHCCNKWEEVDGRRTD